MAGGVFINYRGMDSYGYPTLLYAELSREFGPDLVFLDYESIPAGTDYVAELYDRVRGASVVLAVIGTQWLSVVDGSGQRRIDNPEDWIRRELAEAFQAAVRVIPVLVDDAELPTARQLPADLEALPRCHYRRLRYREAATDVARLADDLTELDEGLRRARERGPYRPAQVACPYPGMVPFGPPDALWFRGREKLLTRLLTRLAVQVRRGGPLVVIGSSGIGKSSLLRAGLLPALAAGDLPIEGSASWPRLYLRPGPDPLGELARQLSGLGIGADLPAAAEIRTTPAALAPAFRRALPDSRVVLVVDQLEELFTHGSSEADQTAMVRALTALAEPSGTRPAPAAVILGLRVDFYSRCAQLPELVPALQDGQVLVTAMTAEERREAIAGPAAAVGLRIEPGLTDLLVAEASGEALPQLAHVLRRTFTQRRGDTLTIEDYRATGGIAQAVAASADAVYDALGETGQRTLRRLMVAMVAIVEGAEDARRRVPRGQLLGGEDSQAGERILGQLIEQRLVTAEDDSYMLSHEALIRAWPRLKEWLTEDRDSLRRHRELTSRASAWDRHGRDPGSLYAGAELELAARWVAAHPGTLSGVEEEFFQASLAAERARQAAVLAQQRAKRRQLRIVRALLAVAVVAGSVAWQQRGHAVQQQRLAERNERTAVDRLSNLMASESNARVDASEPDQALLLALTAVDTRDTAATRAALLHALQAYPRLAKILTGHGPDRFTTAQSTGISGLVFDPHTGELISSGTGDGQIIRWDLRTGRRRPMPLAPRLHHGITALGLSQDGRTLAVGGFGTRAVWDTSTGLPRRTWTTLFGEFTALAGDGRLVTLSCRTLSCTAGGTTVTVWDPATWKPVRSFTQPRPVMAMAMSHHDQRMAVGGCLQDRRDGHPCRTGFAQIWDTATGRQIGSTLTAPGSDITALDVSPDGTQLAAGSRDGRLLHWDLTTGRLRGAFPRRHRDEVTRVLFSPDGRYLASASRDDLAVIWSLPSHGVWDVIGAYRSPVTAIAFSPDGRQFAVGNELNIITVWTLPQYSPVARQLPVTDADPRSVASSPDGRLIATGGSDGTVVVAEANTGAVIRRLRAAPVCPEGLGLTRGRYHPCYLETLTFSQDGTRLAAASPSGNLAIWDTATWARIPDPLAADEPCGSLVCTQGQVNGVALSSDLSLLAAKGKGQLWVWDLARRQLRHHLLGHGGEDVTAAAFSKDVKILASGGKDHTVLVWDLGSARPAGQPLTGHTDTVTGVDFDPNGKRLASNSYDGTIRVWDLSTHQQITELRNDTPGSAGQLTFSPDGGYLAAVSARYFAAVWDTGTFTPYPLLRDPAGAAATGVTTLAFTGDNRHLVSASSTNTRAYITVWDHRLADWRDRACHVVPHNLDLGTINTYTLGKLRVCPNLPVDGSVVRAELTTAQAWVNHKDTNAAATAYHLAAGWVTSSNADDAELSDLVCLHGTVSQHAADVLPACDHALVLIPDSADYLDDRGIARALVGNRLGAADDLQRFVEEATRSGLFPPDIIQERRAWITRLRSGQNPFTRQVLTLVWSEHGVSHGGLTTSCPVQVGADTEWVDRPGHC